jgi:hypothetical protein
MLLMPLYDQHVRGATALTAGAMLERWRRDARKAARHQHAFQQCCPALTRVRGLRERERVV